MIRREFIVGLAGAAAWSLTARAQQRPVPVIGYLSTGFADDYKMVTVPFLQSLKESGYIEGQNVAIEYRWAENEPDRLPALAADLIGRRVAVIVAFGLIPALPAKAATTSMPIVFHSGTDPVASGLVASLNRPGGNLTGSAILSGELAPKRLQLLRELLPDAVLFGVLGTFPSPDLIPAAARTLGLQVVVANAGNDSELEMAFATFSQQRARGVVVSNGPFYNRRIDQLAALATRHALPAIFPYREFALAGGLMSYGSSFAYTARQLGIYTGHILNGEKPADMPVDQATRIELTLNLKTAKALGIEIPTALLVRADEVIE
jgi:putative tryptophan/tyrosine transport system substrate-binding protein